MKWMVMTMVVLVAAWIQTLFPSLSLLGQARPPLLAAVVVFYAVAYPAPVLVAAAIMSGIMFDANGLMPLGVSSLYYCTVGALIQYNQPLWSEGGGVSVAFLTFLTAIGQPLVTLMAAVLFWEYPVGLPGGWWRHLLALAVMGPMAGTLMARLATWLHRTTGTIEEVLNP